MHYTLRIVQPRFSAPLTDVVIELDHLRRLQLGGDTPHAMFFQLKAIFHMLESLGSARIEGNHTTLADYIEARIEARFDASLDSPPPAASPQADLLPLAGPIREIENIERAMDYLDTAVTAGTPLTHTLLRELHALTVDGLTREGDRTPGAYRPGDVRIVGAEHVPPGPREVPPLMDELLAFINAADAPKYDLLKVALAHHRFAWVHPFGNGNGRVVRLFTYALLLKYGFNVGQGGRILNPTAVFCNDRERYYAMLAAADDGSDASLEAWSLYVLEGVRNELVKVDSLARYSTLKRDILLPALAWSRARGQLDADEEKLLRMAVDKGVFKAADIDAVMPHWTSRQRAYQLNKLVLSRAVRPVQPGARSYTLDFLNGTLIRGVIRMLQEQGFVPGLG
jgi:Fic family protein